MEERVAGQDVLAAGHQPVVEPRCWSAVGCSSSQTSAPRPDGPQPGQAELRPVPVGQGLERVELGDVVPGDDDRELEAGESGGGQAVHGGDGRGEGAPAPHGVVDLGRGPVERDLDVDVVAGGQPGGRLAVIRGRWWRTSRRRGGRWRSHQLPEVRAGAWARRRRCSRRRSASARTRRSPPCTRRWSARRGRGGPSSTGSARRPGCRRRSAPRSDRSGRPGPARSGRPGGATRGRVRRGSRAPARGSCRSRPGWPGPVRRRRARGAPRRPGSGAAGGWSASDSTTASRVRLFRNESRRVPKW